MRSCLSLAAIILTLLVCCLSGCFDDTVCCDQSCETQPVIRGQVTGGYGPIFDARIAASYVGPLRDYDAEIKCKTAPDGTYELSVMPGEYQLCFTGPDSRQMVYFGPQGPTCTWDVVRPIVQIDAEQGDLTADFALGALDLDLRLPEILVSSRLNLFAELYGTSHGMSRERAQYNMPTQHVIFDGLLEGSYRISLAPMGGCHPDLEYDPIDLSSLVDSLQVVAGQVTSATLSVPDPGTFSGVVVGEYMQWSDDRPYIYLYGAEEQRQARVRVNADGGYSVPVFVEQDLRAQLRLGHEYYWIGGPDFASASVYSVGPGQDVILDSLSIGALVCHLDYSAWTRFAHLTVYNSAGSWHETYDARAEQTLTIPLFELDSYSLLVHWDSPTQWRPQWYDRAVSSGEATPIVYDVPGATMEVTITLEEGGSISGTVWLTEGVPASHIALRAKSTFQFMSWSGLWMTDEEGHFLIEGLPDGEVRIAAGNPEVVWYPGVASEALAEPILIENASAVTDIEWTLVPALN